MPGGPQQHYYLHYLGGGYYEINWITDKKYANARGYTKEYKVVRII